MFSSSNFALSQISSNIKFETDCKSISFKNLLVYGLSAFVSEFEAVPLRTASLQYNGLQYSTGSPVSFVYEFSAITFDDHGN